MDKIGRPRELIAYATVGNLENATRKPREGWRSVRPRTVLYSVLIAAISGLMGWSLLNRADLQVNVLPDRNPLFVLLSDGGLRNGYTVKITNKQQSFRQFRIAVSGLPGAHVQFVELEGQEPMIGIAPAEVSPVKLFVSLDRAARKELQSDASPLTITVSDAATGEAASRKTIFSGPAQ